MKKILVLEGGFNEEHEISLKTSREVKKSLKRMKIDFIEVLVNPKDFLIKIKQLDNQLICFNSLHGPYGEDGSIQGILEHLKFKFTHSGSQASRAAFDKNLTKKLINNTEVNCIESIVFDRFEFDMNIFYEAFKKFNSFVLKPVSSGSSYGVKIFNNFEDIEKYISNIKDNLKIYNNHNKLMIEKYIKGRELTVAVIESNKISEPIDVTEIVSENTFFDYQAKYTKGFSKHVLPAKLPTKIYDQCLYYAKTVHDTLGCRGISRSDFLYDENNIYFLEINTQPGLTPVSLVPEQLKNRNINFDFLIQKIIDSSL